MNIKCMYCKVENLDAPLSDEHIIPEVLGGTFKIPVVCEKHNKRFGSSLESKLKNNAFIVTALDKLRIQPPNDAYCRARTIINLGDGKGLRGYIDKEGAARFFPQESEVSHQILPEEQAVEVLKKKIERFEKRTGRKIEFNPEEFNNLPYNIAIPIYGTDLAIIKRKAQPGSALIYGLNQPIPFRVIAKICLNHLAALNYPFVMKNEFDLLKRYIIHGGLNGFVMLHTPLSDTEPKNINYLPYHYIRINFVEGGLAAVIALFGTIKFMVFFGEFEKIYEFDLGGLLNNYHVYDINRRNIFCSKGDDKLREWDDILLKSVIVWGKYAKTAPDEY